MSVLVIGKFKGDTAKFQQALADRGDDYLRDLPTSRFTRLSEEHGVLSVPDALRHFAVGDRVEIMPIHVCVWMDLQREIYGMRNGQIVERITVDAMRRSL